MEAALVAKGYEVSEKAIYSHNLRNQDELIENKHYLILQNAESGQIRNIRYWTKRGVIRLGFFIKSKKAKLFHKRCKKS
ncbi:MAG: hypothetical protein MUE85_00810 [Microscillaceae bacterium]|jgi:hypothetical protein|nr:hypothetical protein [Microscillaceae bacterium]